MTSGSALKCVRHLVEAAKHRRVLCGKPFCYICGRMIFEEVSLCVKCYGKSGIEVSQEGLLPQWKVNIPGLA